MVCGQLETDAQDSNGWNRGERGGRHLVAAPALPEGAKKPLTGAVRRSASSTNWLEGKVRDDGRGMHTVKLFCNEPVSTAVSTMAMPDA